MDNIAYAAECVLGTSGVNIGDCYAPASKFTSLADVVNKFSQNIIVIAGTIFFVLILVAGLGLIISAGNKDSKAMEQNQNFLLYAIIGFVIIFSAFWIVQLINYLTGGTLRDLFP